MDRDVFKSKFIEKEKNLTHHGAHKVTEDQRIMGYAHNPNEVNTTDLIVISIEELSELIKELTKHIRGETDYYGIMEELADDQIILNQLCLNFEISCEQLQAAIDIKLDRYE